MGKRKYSLNQDFFESDTLGSFYWAGFIAADGCVSYNQHKSGQLTINLSVKDINLLEKLKNTLSYNGPIKKYTSKTSFGTGTFAKIQTNSTKMVEDLKRFNIVPNKTKTYTFPEWLIDNPLVNHFMRGYVDGDGSFFTTKQSGRLHLNFSLCGTKEFLTTFRSILVKKCLLKSNKVCISRGIFDLRYSGNQNAFKIRDFLYNKSDINIRMDRKYNKSHGSSLIIKPKNQHKFRKVRGYNCKNKHIILLDAMSHGEKLGFSRKSIQACCSGRQKVHRGYTWKYADKKQ